MTDTARLVDVSSKAPRTPVATASEAEERAFLERLRSRVPGSSATIPTPGGEKPLRYFDFIASGRFHADVEEELAEKVIPFMANKNTESKQTGSLMKRYYENAFAKIGAYVGAAESDVLIPVGSGSTGAINRLIHVLGLRVPDQLEERYGLRARMPEEARPVIFRSMMEHHSNDIAWRETIGDTVYVDFDEAGRISVDDLEAKLDQWKGRPWKIGTFSAASNVTGILNDVHALARVLHRHGALAFFDYAAAGPYVDIDMHPADPEERLDAITFSPHKFLGGPGSSGVLVLSNALYGCSVPDQPGGGTVKWTTPFGTHRYVDEIEAREDGGTPGFLQAIRAALAFELKAAMGVAEIRAREKELLDIILAEFRKDTGQLVSSGTAESALFWSETEDAELSGSVRLESKRQDAILEGEFLRWDGKAKRLEGRLDRTVTVSRSDGSRVSGAGFEADARKRSFLFRESVQGYVAQTEKERR